ncbi:hypothetical protein AB6E30_14640 [Vibrio sp. 10N.247.311.12]|uniref:hypothetical protein n=1 Tax=unclassified Vibrio TaxID=2614977 RepID=UPI00354CDBE8
MLTAEQIRNSQIVKSLDNKLQELLEHNELKASPQSEAFGDYVHAVFSKVKMIYLTPGWEVFYLFDFDVNYRYRRNDSVSGAYCEVALKLAKDFIYNIDVYTEELENDELTLAFIQAFKQGHRGTSLSHSQGNRDLDAEYDDLNERYHSLPAQSEFDKYAMHYHSIFDYLHSSMSKKRLGRVVKLFHARHHILQCERILSKI